MLWIPQATSVAKEQVVFFFLWSRGYNFFREEEVVAERAERTPLKKSRAFKPLVDKGSQIAKKAGAIDWGQSLRTRERELEADQS